MWSSSSFILTLEAAVFIANFAASQTDAISISDYSDCDSNLGTLERALYETEANLFELNRIFFPPSLLPTRFVRVEYTFFDDENYNDDCKVTYIWAVGEVLFLQPPTLFKLNSLYFYFPNNELTTLSLRLPIECIPLINGTDGVCSCMNDSHMLDILTQQLNIYARFTNQANIERSNSFARAVCAGELYDIYYSGKNVEFKYIVVASAIAGPLIIFVLTLACLIGCFVLKFCKLKQDNKEGIKLQTKAKRKNLVAFVSVGIYISFYILILDIFAMHTAHTSSHEYEPELSVQSRNGALNLIVTYITFACDLVVCIQIIATLIIIFCFHISICKCTKPLGETIFELGNHPLKGTAKKSPAEKLSDAAKELSDAAEKLSDSAKKISDATGSSAPLDAKPSKLSDTAKKLSDSAENKSGPAYYASAQGRCSSDDINSILFPSLLIPPLLCIISHLGYIILAWITQPSRSTTTLILYYFVLFYLYLILRNSYKHGLKVLKFIGDSQSKYRVRKYIAESVESKNINMPMFFLNLFLGLLYLGIAVIFIAIVYVKPLASEDLFSYLFNVVQFVIVVVSTQFFYKLIVGKSFSIKKTIKTVHEILMDKNYDYNSLAKENLDKKTGNLVVALISQLLPSKEASTANSQSTENKETAA